VITPGALISAAMPDELPEPATTVIGIVDGVINITNPLTGPHVLAAEQFPAGYAFSGADAHGTAVTGTAIWGDLDQLVTGGTLPVPHPVISARVLDLTPGNTYGVTGLARTTIEDAIRWLMSEHRVRIVNLSINFPVAATSALRDELTVTVDTVARELGVVIVVSAGNRDQLPNRHWLTDYPAYLMDIDAKIAAPGDAALAVTVGLPHDARRARWPSSRNEGRDRSKAATLAVHPIRSRTRHRPSRHDETRVQSSWRQLVLGHLHRIRRRSRARYRRCRCHRAAGRPDRRQRDRHKLRRAGGRARDCAHRRALPGGRSQPASGAHGAIGAAHSESR
jgi:hypothetical protein